MEHGHSLPLLHFILVELLGGQRQSSRHMSASVVSRKHVPGTGQVHSVHFQTLWPVPGTFVRFNFQDWTYSNTTSRPVLAERMMPSTMRTLVNACAGVMISALSSPSR
jgi:hypothetical protein